MNIELEIAEQEAITQWFSEILGETYVAETQSFLKMLQDGSVLCRVMNHLIPGSVPAKNLRPARSQVERVANIASFLASCQAYSPDILIFKVEDLLEGKNMSPVRKCLLELKAEYLMRNETAELTLSASNLIPVSSDFFCASLTNAFQGMSAESLKNAGTTELTKLGLPDGNRTGPLICDDNSPVGKVPKETPVQQNINPYSLFRIPHSDSGSHYPEDAEFVVIIKKTESLGLGFRFSFDRKVCVSSIDANLASLDVQTQINIHDQLYSINGERLVSLAHLIDVLRDFEEGEKMEFSIRRQPKKSFLEQQPSNCSQTVVPSTFEAILRPSEVRPAPPEDDAVRASSKKTVTFARDESLKDIIDPSFRIVQSPGIDCKCCGNFGFKFGSKHFNFERIKQKRISSPES